MSTLTRQAYASGHFAFRLDQSKKNGTDIWDTSWLRSVEGGAVKSAVINDTIGQLRAPFSYYGGVEVEPITVEAGIAACRPILQWIQDSWTSGHKYRTGAITHGDFHYKGVAEQRIEDALIEEVTFPTLDGNDKNPVYLKVKMRPERVTITPDSANLDADRAFQSNRQKTWTPSSFVLALDGDELKYVRKIESFTIKQKIKELHVGGQRYAELVPVGVEFPRLTLTMSATYAQPFIDWHQAAVVRHAVDLGQTRKQGRIKFLDPNVRDDLVVLFTLELHEVGISSLSFDKSEGGAEAIKRCQVELFVDSMTLELGSI